MSKGDWTTEPERRDEPEDNRTVCEKYGHTFENHRCNDCHGWQSGNDPMMTAVEWLWKTVN